MPASHLLAPFVSYPEVTKAVARVGLACVSGRYLPAVVWRRRKRSVNPRDLASRAVLLLGAPRSGTTWLGKIFDSHPNVLYRNEPDTELPSETLSLLCRVEDLERYRYVARAYLERLIDTRKLRSAGS